MILARLLPLLIAAPVRAADNLPPTALAPPVGAADGLRWMLALAVVLAAVFGLAWLLRRAGNLSPLGSAGFRVLGAVSVGTRERAVLLQAGNKQLVLGVAPGRVQTLCVLEGDDRIPLDASPVTLSPFAACLDQLRGKKP